VAAPIHADGVNRICRMQRVSIGGVLKCRVDWRAAPVHVVRLIGLFHGALRAANRNVNCIVKVVKAREMIMV
jgi:hypothetical protein